MSETTMSLEDAFKLGVAHQEARRFVEAEAVYRALIGVRPEVATFHNNLGISLRGQGRLADAAEALRKAADLQPANILARYNLANLLLDVGRQSEAVVLFREALALDASDPQGVGLCLAALGVAQTPERAPAQQMERIYGVRARTWDQDPKYRGAALVADALLSRLTAPVDVLDLGCGTGQVGERVKPKARQLIGVDLSQPMLEVASAKGCYDNLHRADLLTYLAEHPDQFGAIGCAATLLHFGDLEPAFSMAFAALRAGGLFALTLLPAADPEGFEVGPMTGAAQSGVFRHGRYYVRVTAERAGFDVLQVSDEIHEHSDGKDVTGLLVLLARPRRP